MNGVRLTGLLRKEMTQLLRDRWVLGLVLWLYTVEVIVCTYALSFEIEDLPAAVVDQDQSVSSRELIRLFDVTDAFELTRETMSTARAVEWLEAGRVGIVLVIPTGFEHSYQSAIGPTVQVLLDGTNSNTAANARNYAIGLLRRFEAQRPSIAGHDSGATAKAVPRVWYNPDQTTKLSWRFR